MKKYLLIAAEPKKIPIIIGIFNDSFIAEEYAKHMESKFDSRYFILEAEEV